MVETLLDDSETEVEDISDLTEEVEGALEETDGVLLTLPASASASSSRYHR